MRILLAAIGSLLCFAASGSIAAPVKKEALPGNWHYDVKKSALGVVTKTVCTLSLNQIRLGFPYKNTRARLCVRPPVLHQNDLEVFVELVGNGQIITDEGVQTKFDDEEPGGYRGYGANDGSTDTVWLGDSYDALVEIRHAKKTIMELTFYQNGTQALTFNTGGLMLPEIGECDRDPAFAAFDKGKLAKQPWCQPQDAPSAAADANSSQ